MGENSDNKAVLDTLCPVPWKQLAMSPMGTVRLCCDSEPKIGLSRDSSGRPYRLPTDLESALNSEMFGKVRQQMKNGQWAPQCEACRLQERAEGTSSRINWRSIYPNFSAESQSTQIALASIDNIDLRLGNRCNLRCRMCSPNSSSAWTEEWEKLGTLVDQIPDANRQRLDSHWEDDGLVLESLRQLIPGLRRVYLTGGEPLLVRNNKRFLTECIALGRAGQIALQYTTNGTVIDSELFDLWKHFKEVSMMFSIDGVSALNEYIRFPSKWERVTQNIDAYRSAAREVRLALSMNCTVQAYNIFQLPEIANFAEAKGMAVFFFPLRHPPFLSTAALPEKLSRAARAHLAQHFEHRQKEEIIATLTSSQSSLWGKFLEFSHRLDGLRGQKLADIVPELLP